MGILENKTAVITGASRGFGLAIAKQFLKEGCRVVLASRGQSSIDTALKEIGAGDQACGTTCDVADLSMVQALADYAIERFGDFDIWVNNAGIAGPYGPTTGISPVIFESVAHTNILGVYNGSITALKHFLPRGQGKLINMLGHGAKEAVPFQSAYASSKAWVRMFTLALAGENRGSGVGIFAFQPGMMLTDLLLEPEVVAGSEDRLKSFPTVVRILAKPPEVPARKLAWVASSATDGLSGKSYDIASPLGMLGSALREGLKHLSRQTKTDEIEIHIKSIPFDGK